MRILFAADAHRYSEYALNDLVKLAENTFADVTMLGILPKNQAEPAVPGTPVALEHPLLEAMDKYRQTFLDHWPEGSSPYERTNFRYEWISLKERLWEQILVARGSLKDLKIRVCFGSVLSEIVKYAKEEDSDLIVLGCTKGSQCRWEDYPSVPQKVVSDAECSVLLVKEAQPIRHIWACLDESNVSQASLEMINQMATIHQCPLSIVALTKGGGIKTEVFPWLDEAHKYFQHKGLQVEMRYQEIDEFEGFISREVQEGLVAMWMGKRSLLDRLSQKNSLWRYVDISRTSVLILR